MRDLYDTDVFVWSEQQSELLRRRAAGELVNEAELDWPNIAEEIADVGNEQRNAVESLLVNILQHLLQLAAWPEADAARHWRHEVTAWRVTLARRLKRAPSLDATLEHELSELYADALAMMYAEVDGVPRPEGSVSDHCPWTLAQAMNRDFWPE